MKITLDTNCIIDLEVQRTMTPVIEQLVQQHQAGAIQLQLPAIMASERRLDGSCLHNFSEFQDRIAKLGLQTATILNPLAYFGVAFFGWSILSGPELEAQEKAIHEILFPMIPFLYIDYCAANGLILKEKEVDGKWRNAKCDVQAIWCHIHYGGDVFLTSDGNFHKKSKKGALEALGAKKIALPNELSSGVTLPV